MVLNDGTCLTGKEAEQYLIRKLALLNNYQRKLKELLMTANR